MLKWLTKIPQPVLSIINILFVILALWLSIRNAKESARFQGSVVSGLVKMTALSDTLRSSLESLPRSVLAFDTGIRDLNTIIQKQQDSLRRAVSFLSDGVARFSSSLVSYQQNLNQIVAATDRQISLLKNTQERWEEEITRKPDLYLKTTLVALQQPDTLLVEFTLCNKGNRTAQVVGMYLTIPGGCNLSGEKWLPIQWAAAPNAFSYAERLTVPFSTDTTSDECFMNGYMRFRLMPVQADNFPLLIRYAVHEDWIGTQEGVLQILRPSGL